MLDKFDALVEKFSELERKMSDPEIIADQSVYQELVKKHADLKDSVACYQRYKKLLQEISDTQTLLTDPELKSEAQQELNRLDADKDRLWRELQIFLIPIDPNDKKNALVEIRSGTGGEEAALFAAELFRMYTRYAESRHWKTEVLSKNVTGLGGVKEIVFSIAGQQVFSRLKFESGIHRVQRVPATEASGRVHTSAATVAILPEAEEVDIHIDPKDLRTDVYRASGAGGQHVNKTSSAVRITHIPTNTVVACQDERSQFQNKDKAMRMLRTKLYEVELERQQQKESSMRKSQVGSGDRSEKIRTYNYPQNRVTDHRINLTLYNLNNILDGDLDELVDALISADRLAKMQQ